MLRGILLSGLLLWNFGALAQFQGGSHELFGSYFGFQSGTSSGGPPPPVCPKGVSPDGCTAGQIASDGSTIPGPPTVNANSLQHSNFFLGYANQAGQTYVIRPNYNVAGVEYPVGIGSSTYSGSLTAALNGTNHSNISHCAGPADAGGAAGQINCATDQGGGGLTVNGFDFSNSGHCLSVYIDHQSGPITITNNKFAVNSSTAPDCGAQTQVLNVGADNSGSATVSYNLWTGSPGCYTGTSNLPDTLLAMSNTGAQRAEYNALQCAVVKGLSTGNGGTTLGFMFNYVECCYGTGTAHGDGTFVGPTTGKIYQDYNVVLGPQGSGGMSCMICVANGTGPQTYNGEEVTNNTVVANLISPGVGVVSPGEITDLHANNYTNGIVVSNNWADTTGSLVGGAINLGESGGASTGSVSGSGNECMVQGTVIASLANNWTSNYPCPTVTCKAFIDDSGVTCFTDDNGGA